MAERSLRGMSIGAKSLESDDNVDFAARRNPGRVGVPLWFRGPP